MTTAGRIEVRIKVNQPSVSETTENNWHRFSIDCDSKQISVAFKPKVWNRFKA